jgi:cystine transport system substrate-binding protein
MRFIMHLISSVALSAVLALGALIAGSRSEAMAGLVDDVRNRGTLLVGLEGTYPPFNFQDENGELTGFEVEFANALAARLGVKAEFRPTKWDGMLAALETQRFDIVINQVTITEERKAQFDFSEPYTISGIQILVRKGEEDEYKTPEDLSGKAVGVVLGTNYEQWLREHVPDADIRTYDDDPTRNQDLLVGRIDAILNDRLIAGNLMERYEGRIVPAGEPFARQEMGIATRKGDPEFLAALNKAIDELRQDGTLEAISRKWFQIDVTR